jgi:hypothetical protein
MKKKADGALTAEEKPIVKRLLSDGWRNQDIQALLNLGRTATVNSGRVTEVKQNTKIKMASKEVAEFFVHRKNSLDLKTGLNFYDHERLIRAREAMVLAVQIFNNPSLNFKTEVFSVSANIAWTYLMHEYYERRGVNILQADGRALLLSQIIRRTDCPLSQGIKDNLDSLKEIRDAVEHTLFRKSDLKFMSVFQACCLNFDKTLVELFGEKTTLRHELSFALQFAQMDVEQLATLSKFDVPKTIHALEKKFEEALGEERSLSTEYRFRVVYTLENSTKSKAHIKFIHPDDEDADEIRNVLIKNELADKLYPFKASRACAEINKKSGLKFTSHNHTQAWKKFDVRPRSNANERQNTNKDFCVYHEVHGDYTYSQKWIDFVSKYICDDKNFQDLKAYKTKQ